MERYKERTGVSKDELFNIITDAGHYVVLKEKKKFLEIDIVKHKQELIYIEDRLGSVKRRIDDLEKVAESLSEEFEKVQKDLIKHQTEKEKLEKDHEKVVQLEILSKELDEIKQEHDSVCIIYNLSLDKERKNQEELEELLALKEWYEAEKARFDVDLKNLLEEIFALEEKRKKIKDTIPSYTTPQSSKKAEVELESCQKSINETTQKLARIDEDIAVLSADANKLIEEENHLIKRKDELTAKINELELYENEEVLREEIEKLKAKQIELIEAIKEKKGMVESKTTMISNTEEEIKGEIELKKEFEAKEQKLKENKVKIKTINDEITAFEGNIELHGKVLEISIAVKSYTDSVTGAITSEIEEYRDVTEDFAKAVHGD